ncbi:hypothetical protein M8494_19975 [Serratia ureilytica]
MGDSLSVDELAQKKDRWYRIVEEMLAEAGVAINGPRAWDNCTIRAVQTHLQEGSPVSAKVIRDGWWGGERPDMLSPTRILQAGR